MSSRASTLRALWASASCLVDNAAQSGKNRFFFASARPVRNRFPMLSKERHASVMIGCHGGMACRNGKIISGHTPVPDFERAVSTLLKASPLPYVLEGQWNYSVSDGHRDMLGLYTRAVSLHDGVIIGKQDCGVALSQDRVAGTTGGHTGAKRRQRRDPKGFRALASPPCPDHPTKTELSRRHRFFLAGGDASVSRNVPCPAGFSGLS